MKTSRVCDQVIAKINMKLSSNPCDDKAGCYERGKISDIKS